MIEIQPSVRDSSFGSGRAKLCHLGGHAPESGEIIGIPKLKDDMPADLADSLKADEEDRKTDHAPLVAVTENEEVATLTATIGTNLETGAGSLSRDQASSEWEERQKSRSEELVTIHDTVNLQTEVGCMKGALAETQNSLAGDEASSEWAEERQKSRTDELRSRLLLRRSSPQSMRRFLCPRDSTGGCAHSSTRMLWFFFFY